jgi:WD40 repeat protein
VVEALAVYRSHNREELFKMHPAIAIASMSILLGFCAAGSGAQAPDAPDAANAPAIAVKELNKWKVREGVGALCFSPDGQSIYSVAGRPGVLRQSGELGILNVTTGEVRQFALGGSFATVVINREGTQMAAAGEGGLVIVDLSVPKVIKRFPASNRLGPKVIGFLDKDRTLLVVSDGAVELWSVADGKASRPLKGHVDLAVRTGALSDDQTKLATTGPDGVVRTWDVASWGLEAEVARGIRGHDVMFNPAVRCYMRMASRTSEA